MLGQPNIDSPLCWVMAFSSLLISAVLFGVTYSFGIFYVAILQEFPGTESETAWIMSINMGTLMLMSPLTISICRRLTPRIVCCLGTLLGGLALFLASKTTNIVMLYFTFGMMHGVGTSFCYVAPLLILRTNFKRFLDLACGISGAGVGLGGCLFSIILPGLIEAYGWRGALRICSYITFAATILGTIFVQRTDHAKEVVQKIEKAPPARTNSVMKVIRLGGSSPWRNKAFIVLNISLLLGGFVTAIPYCHIVNFAIKQGLTKGSASTLSVFLSIGSTIGRLSIGKLTGLCGMTRIFLVQTLFLILAVAMTLCSLATTAASLIIFACVVGATDGGFNILLAVVVDDVFTDKKQALKALGHMFGMFCLPYIFGSPLAGWLYQMTRSYHTVFYMCGALYFIASCLMSIVRCLQPPSYSTTVSYDQPYETMASSVHGNHASTHTLIPREIPADLAQTGRLIKSKTCSMLDLPVELYFRSEGGSHLTVPDTHSTIAYTYSANNVAQAKPSYTEHSYSININDSKSACDVYTDIAKQISGLNRHQLRKTCDFSVGPNESHVIRWSNDVTAHDATVYYGTGYDGTADDVTTGEVANFVDSDFIIDRNNINDLENIVECHDISGHEGNAFESDDSVGKAGSPDEVVMVSEELWVDNGYASSPSTTQYYDDSEHSCSIQSTLDSTYGSLDGIPDIVTEQLPFHHIKVNITERELYPQVFSKEESPSSSL